MKSLFISSLSMFFSRNLSVRFIRFLFKHYDGFAINHIPNFRPPNFFRERRDLEISIYGFFMGKLYFFSPVCTGVSKTIPFFALINEVFLLERRVVYFCEIFTPVFVKERVEPSQFFRNRFDIPPWPLSFLTLTLFSYNLIGRTPLLIS